MFPMEPMLERDPALVALEAKLPPETWQARVEEARAQHAIIMAVRAAQAEGLSEMGALARDGAGMDPLHPDA